MVLVPCATSRLTRTPLKDRQWAWPNAKERFRLNDPTACRVADVPPLRVKRRFGKRVAAATLKGA